jgi:DNA-binding NarL/FixJ family response regulator
MTAIRILLADDHTILREGLRTLLEHQPDMTVVAEAGDGRQAVRLAAETEPDVAVLDIGMPDLNGIEATRQILRVRPEVKVIALSMHGDRRFVVEMLRAGAVGYLVKDAAVEAVVSAIRQVDCGQVFLGPGVTDVVVDEFVKRLDTDKSPAQILTTREREVAQLIAEGCGTKEVAAKLFVSVKTVESHRTNIMRKLGIRTVAELTKFAIREGLTSLD